MEDRFSLRSSSYAPTSRYDEGRQNVSAFFSIAFSFFASNLSYFFTAEIAPVKNIRFKA
jgi:hypothetical protein